MERFYNANISSKQLLKVKRRRVKENVLRRACDLCVFTDIFFDIMLHDFELPLRWARLLDGKSWETDDQEFLGNLTMWVTGLINSHSWKKVCLWEMNFNYSIRSRWNSKCDVQHGFPGLFDSRLALVSPRHYRSEKGPARVSRTMDSRNDARYLRRTATLLLRRVIRKFKVWTVDCNIIHNRILRLVSQCKHYEHKS